MDDPNMSRVPEVNIVEHVSIQGGWVVEHIDADGDGGIAVTIFAECHPRERAEEYARWLRVSGRGDGS